MQSRDDAICAAGQLCPNYVATLAGLLLVPPQQVPAPLAGAHVARGECVLQRLNHLLLVGHLAYASGATAVAGARTRRLDAALGKAWCTPRQWQSGLLLADAAAAAAASALQLLTIFPPKVGAACCVGPKLPTIVPSNYQRSAKCFDHSRGWFLGLWFLLWLAVDDRHVLGDERNATIIRKARPHSA